MSTTRARAGADVGAGGDVTGGTPASSPDRPGAAGALVGVSGMVRILGNRWVAGPVERPGSGDSVLATEPGTMRVIPEEDARPRGAPHRPGLA
ncbi:hypothetical protein Cde04nite_33300 [Cellulomonas denverensis]|nr:hypothetical protein Cde04nite_33300 [Cellulomonas denverensis]